MLAIDVHLCIVGFIQLIIIVFTQIKADCKWLLPKDSDVWLFHGITLLFFSSFNSMYKSPIRKKPSITSKDTSGFMLTSLVCSKESLSFFKSDISLIKIMLCLTIFL